MSIPGMPADRSHEPVRAIGIQEIRARQRADEQRATESELEEDEGRIAIAKGSGLLPNPNTLARVNQIRKEEL